MSGAAAADGPWPVVCEFIPGCPRPATHEFERAPGLGWIPLCARHAEICQAALPSGTLRGLTSSPPAR